MVKMFRLRSMTVRRLLLRSEAVRRMHGGDGAAVGMEAEGVVALSPILSKLWQWR